jgi:DNA-binding MarR family transcriptional regulator
MNNQEENKWIAVYYDWRKSPIYYTEKSYKEFREIAEDIDRKMWEQLFYGIKPKENE